MDFITYQEALEIMEAGLQTWEEVKKTFSAYTEMTAFLKGAYPVICLDHHQLDLSSPGISTFQFSLQPGAVLTKASEKNWKEKRHSG